MHSSSALIFTKSYSDSSYSSAFSVSTLKAIHHSRLTVCLPDSLDLDSPAYQFCFSQAPVNKVLPTIAFVGAVDISKLMITILTD